MITSIIINMSYLRSVFDGVNCFTCSNAHSDGSHHYRQLTNGDQLRHQYFPFHNHRFHSSSSTSTSTSSGEESANASFWYLKSNSLNPLFVDSRNFFNSVFVDRFVDDNKNDFLILFNFYQ